MAALTPHEKRQFLAAYIRHLGYDPAPIVVSKIGLFRYGHKIPGGEYHNAITKYKPWYGIDGIKIFIYRKRNRL